MSDTEHLYDVHLEWKEGKIGTLSSPVLNNEITVATPPEFEGGVAGIWSPEHLFVAAVSSCFMTTFTAIAGFSKLDYKNLNVAAEGKMEKVDGKFVISAITLKAELTIFEDDKKDKAIRIMEKSEAACLISRSIKTEVHLEPTVLIS
ncbi:MAG: OsmC family protein [Balneolaceae bacterium]